VRAHPPAAWRRAEVGGREECGGGAGSGEPAPRHTMARREEEE